MFVFIWITCVITSVISFNMVMLPCKLCHCFNDTRVVTADCRYRNLTSIPDDLPSDVTTLLLAHNNINNLSSDYLQLSNLRHLDLSFNDLHNLQTRVFVRLSFLEELNLEGNCLPLNNSGYPRGVFQNLTRLRSLRLNNNTRNTDKINGMNYPSQELGKLLALEELFIDGLPTSILGPEFKHLHNFTNLTLSGNIGQCNIPNITRDYFTNLGNLQHLIICTCNVQYIDPEAFTRLRRILSINISDNTKLGFSNAVNLFYGLQNSSLKILHINAIVDEFVTCVRVTKEVGSYLGSTNLTELHADSNYIVTVEDGTLKQLGSLQVLSIRNSRLVFGRYFRELVSMKHLKSLDLSGQRVGSKIPRLLFSKINIFIIPPNLEVFYSDDSMFRIAFDNVHVSRNCLKKISYKKNVTPMWKGPVYGLSCLEEIDLSENYCEGVTLDFLKGFYNLRILRANRNYLGSFLRTVNSNQVFEYSTKLTFLDLSLNKIDDLPVNIFKSQVNLQTLNLSRNSISNLKIKVNHMINLSNLNLMSNRITSFSRDFTSQLYKHSNLKVDLSQNPLLCSCDTLWFIQWMTERKVKFISRDNYTCSSESEWLSGRNVFGILSDLKAHCTSYLGMAMGLLAAVTSVVCITFAAIIFRYRWKLRYLYYVARGHYRGHAVIQNDDARDYEYDAFVSYADEDRGFALHTFIKELENKDNIHLCLHHRDFTPGEPISANILSAIQRSRHVVIVLSPNFLDSYWCRWEFEMARMESLYTERNMVVLVKYQEVNPRLVPRDMLYMMHTQTYLEFPQDPNDQETFWVALRQSVKDQ